MDCRLPDELVAFQEAIRRFVNKELMPVEGRVQREGLSSDLRDELATKAHAAGFWLLDLPESLGGQGLGLLGKSVFFEEIGRTVAVPARDPSIFGPLVGPILASLQGPLAERYLHPVLRGEKRACFAQTEPDAGSDPAGMRSRAILRDGVYVLNGRKRFITGAHEADFAQVFAVTESAEPGKELIGEDSYGNA